MSNNGYFTGATDVEIGNARLQYEFLDLVNEARAAEGHAPLNWVESDASEEYTLIRVDELVNDFSHNRPNGSFAGEVIGRGYATVRDAFNGWMNSPAHKQTLMSDSNSYMSAARAGNHWIICVWDKWGIKLVDQWAENNYDMSSILGS